MKKLAIILFAIGFISNLQSYSQNVQGKANDLARITLNAVVPEQVDEMPEAARSFLQNKLSQIATTNGLGGVEINPRFVITSGVHILTKDITPTAPPRIAYTLSFTLYIVDAIEQKVFASTNIEARGVGNNEMRAYTEAIKNLNVRSPQMKNFVETGKSKILEYYNSQCDFIITEARSLAGRKEFEEAIFKLTSIPEVCMECYTLGMEAAETIYLQYADYRCQQLLNEASSRWAANMHFAGAQQAAELLALIDPESSCMPGVNNLVAEMKQRVLQVDQREWDFNVATWSDRAALESERIRAIRDIGVAWGSRWYRRYNFDLSWLWM